MYRLIQTKIDGSEYQIHWNITTIVIEDELGSREEEVFDYVTVTNFNIQYLQSLGVPQFIIDEIGTDEVIEGVEPIEVMKYVQLPAAQSYNGIMTAINIQRGYPNHKLGVDRYATDDIEQFAATDGKYYVPIWYDLQELPIFTGLTLVERDAFTYVSELLHPVWKPNEQLVSGDVRWSADVYYECIRAHTTSNKTQPPHTYYWTLHKSMKPEAHLSSANG